MDNDNWIIETYSSGHKIFYPASKKEENDKIKKDISNFMEELELMLMFGINDNNKVSYQ